MRRDRDGKGGGIMLLINSDFLSSRRTDLEFDSLENLYVEVQINVSKWLILGIDKQEYLETGVFPNILKEAQVTPIHKKNYALDKTNYNV